MPMNKDTVVFAITPERRDGRHAGRPARSKRKGHPTLGICNTVGRTIARETDGGVYMHAGPEIGVAATKSFTSQSCPDPAGVATRPDPAPELPQGCGSWTSYRHSRQSARKCSSGRRQYGSPRNIPMQQLMFLGRHSTSPLAMEGALKMKEISYIHAEGLPAAEMKHGSIALINERRPLVFFMPHGVVYDKIISNIEEVKARSGQVIAVASEGDSKLRSPTTSSDPRLSRFRSRCSPSIPLHCWPITWRWLGGATWTSRGTWPRA